MSIVLRAEFATICKTTPAIVNTNVSRGKITVTGHNGKYVDTENALNKIFKKNQLAKAKADKAEQVAVKKTKTAIKYDPPKPTTHQLYNEVVEKVGTKKESAAEKKAREKKNEEDEEDTNWDRRKKIADALKAEASAEKERLAVEKMMGLLIPVDLTQQIFSINIKNIIYTYEAHMINIASIYCDILAGGDRSRLAEITEKLREKLKYLTDQAQQTAAQEIENTIQDYAEVRNRGERK